MSAPLYSRYRRYAHREANRFPRKSIMAKMLLEWKRPNTRVYALSERASHEAGCWSTSEPGELLRAMSLHFLPTPQVWVEFDFVKYAQGTQGVPLDHSVSAVPGGPIRGGMMFKHPVEGDPSIFGFLFYLFDSGATFIGPPIIHWHPSEAISGHLTEVFPDANHDKLDRSLIDDSRELALGRDYMVKIGSKQPRLLKTLASRVMLGMITVGLDNKVAQSNFQQIEGTTRMAVALLTAALSARRQEYAPTQGPRPKSKPRARSERDRPIEVDLFIRERPRKPGGSIRASVGHLEGVKKGLHTVGAHWAYRHRKDGGDPTQCTKGSKHDFEEIEGTKSEVCILCGQKRWFRDTHERGDEKYGIVGPRIYNVRVGDKA